ncbi:unnamed protein product [Candida verbasci]|uniref:Peptidase M3A/M3B catalytic domain-containing protein n=1 Tax=Candida verbasci TaxID=1227364 RepID=A0A9W4TTA0_9ASCO|nr:unnamed protein product [Candida verbasci]
MYHIVILILSISLYYYYNMSTEIDFDQLIKNQSYPSWKTTPEEVVEISRKLADSETKLFDQIANITEPTLNNVLKPFAIKANNDGFPEGQATFYQHVSTNKELRDASTQGEEIIEKNSIEQWSREDVYKIFDKLYKSIDVDSIDGESKRYLDKIITAFKRNGLALDKEPREKVKKLQVELNNLQVQFSKNLNEDKGYVAFTIEELDGVPQDVIDSYEKLDDGKLKVIFNYPDIIPLFKHANNSNTRKVANLAYSNRVSENDPILTEIIKIRFKIAKLLGYETYSDYVLEERMAKTKYNVLNFLNDLREKLKPVASKELATLKEFKAEDLKSRGLEPEDELYSWDYNYYNEKLLERKYQVDNIKIAEYFPLESTLDKIMNIYETIFDIKFVKNKTSDPNAVWHEDVHQFAIYQDIKSGKPEFLGWLYIDLHPREGKYGHAANFGLGPGFEEENGDRHTPITSLVCNFTKPTKEKPSLLQHSEVVTLLHELGHGLHSLVSKTKYARFHGTRVERDFVETPSQMLENWCWKKDQIKQLSSHYKTGEQISDDLIDSLIRSKKVNVGLFTLRQLFFGLFDMKLHTIDKESELEKLSLFEIWNQLREDVTLLPSDNNPTKGYSSFGHIAGGYESGYYGYLYSLVYAADIFHTLFEKNPMNVENGIRYRDIILKPGGSKDIMNNLEELLGRKPNSDAFLQEIFG